MGIKFNPFTSNFDFTGPSSSGGAVSSVTASNSTLTISPTTGAVLAAVNQGANFSWTGTHGFSLDITVPHEAYGVAWNGSNEVPTKDALYDKINSLAPGGVTSVSNSDGTLTVSPTTGNVVASVNQAFDFHWTGLMDFGNYIHTIYGLSSNQGGAGVLLFDGTQTRLADDNGIVIDGGFVQMQNYGTDFLFCDAVSITIALPITTYQSITAGGDVTGTNLSGTNTGDQTSIVGITGTMAQFNTAVSDGNILFNNAEGLGFRFENRTSDPGTPTVGQVWLRTDL